MTTPAQADETKAPQEPQVEQVSEPTEKTEDASASLEAGFNKVRNRETPKPAPKREPVKDSKEVKKEVAKPQASDTKAEENDPPSVIPGYTDKQLRALLSKAPEVETKMANEIRKLHGKIGEISGLIKQIQTAKPTYEGRKITASALKKISADYPDLAEALAEDLTSVYAPEKPPEPKGLSQEQQEARFNERLEQAKSKLQSEFQEELLTVRHKDWRKIVPPGAPQHDEFKSWWYSLPEEKRRQYDSPKAEITAEALDEFKAISEKKKKVKETKDKRLEAAITPKGDGAPTKSTIPDEDALERGFRKVRRR